MTKQFSFKQLFTLTDGNLSTNISDVYDMLNHIYNENFMIYHLPVAMDHLDMKKPQWYADLRITMAEIKTQAGTDDFDALMEYIDKNHNPMIEVPQFTKEELIGFDQYMADNSLLLSHYRHLQSRRKAQTIRPTHTSTESN